MIAHIIVERYYDPNSWQFLYRESEKGSGRRIHPMMSWLAYDEIACQRWDKSLGASDSDLETLVKAAVERANIYISLDTRTAPEF